MKRWRLVLILILVGLILGIFISRVLTIRHLRAELAQLAGEKAKIQKEIERLSARLREKDNLQLIEYLARKELGMVKPGEELYIIIEDGEAER